MFLFNFCSNSIDIYQLKFEILMWDQLDEDIQLSFFDYQNTNIIDLNSNTVITLNRTGIEGLKKGRLKFHYHNKEYFFKWNGYKEVTPFIIKNNKLYVLYDNEGGGPMFRTKSTLSQYKYYQFELPR